MTTSTPAQYQIAVLADTISSPAYQAIERINHGGQLEQKHNVELLVADTVEGFQQQFGGE
jgi:hypothetical protein